MFYEQIQIDNMQGKQFIEFIYLYVNYIILYIYEIT